MQLVTLHNTDLSVSPLCLGIAEAGLKYNEKESFGIFNAFCESGGNFIDTARVYSDWVPGERNRSERILGDWLASRSDRQALIIATKGGHPELSTMHIPRLSLKELSIDLNGSLKSLRTDYIDLYWLHRDDPSRPAGEVIEHLNQFVKQGKIRYFGCSNWTVPRIREANEYALRHDITTFVASQCLWNVGCFQMKPINDRTIVTFDNEMYRLHQESGLTAVPFSSQAGGFFTYFHTHDQGHWEQTQKSGYNTPGNQWVYATLRESADSLHMSMTEIVLAYLLSQPITVVPIIGCRSISQLNVSMSAVGKAIPLEILEKIEKSTGSGIEHR
jgi:aryl-alcohol dehydrogenase-like predicted oxidoreductase